MLRVLQAHSLLVSLKYKSGEGAYLGGLVGGVCDP